MVDPLPADVVANWWEFQRRLRGTRAERKALELGEPVEVQAAHELIERRLDAGGAQAVQLLAGLAEAGPAEDDGVTVGVGPLETLLQEHGDSVIDEVERTAGRSLPFARALSHVWLERGQLSTATEKRLAGWVPMLAEPC